MYLLELTCWEPQIKKNIKKKKINQYTIEVKSLHTPCRICKMLIILPKYEGSYKMRVIFLFITDLNKIFNIKDSPQEKIIVEIGENFFEFEDQSKINFILSYW